MADKLSNVLSIVGIDQGGADISTKKGDVHITGVEVAFFNKIFSIVDTDADDKVGGKEGAQFLRRSGLDSDTLANIWKLACGGKSKPNLSRNGWMLACKLVAIAQQDEEPSMKKLVNGGEYPLPNFALDFDSDYQEELNLPTDGTPAIVANVEKPHTVGTFMNKHTEYTISVSTSLTTFPESKLKVSRRYSDFEWLNIRLKHKFMDRVIPPIPEKQQKNRFAKDFVEGRLLGLQNFVNEVIADPTLVATYEVQLFFTVSSEGMSACRSLLPDGDDVIVDSVTKAWNATKQGVKSVVETATGTTVDIKDELDESEFKEAESSLVNYSNIIKDSVTAGDKLVANQKNTARELQCLSTYYINFMKVARTYETEEALDFFTTAGEQVKLAADLLREDAETQHSGIVTSFRYLQGKAGSVRAVMKNRARSEKLVAKANKLVNKKMKELKEAKEEGDKKAIKLAKKELEEAKESVTKKEANSEEVLKGVKDGFLAFHKERISVSADSLIKHVESRITFNEKLISKYTEMINALVYTDEEKKLSQERLERVAQEEQDYLANLEKLEAAAEEGADYDGDDGDYEESDDDDDDDSDDDSDDSDAPKKKSKKAAKKPAKKAAKKPAKKSKKVESDSDDDDDDDDDDDSDSDYADL